VLTYTAGIVHGFVRSRPELETPDVQFHGAHASYGNYRFSYMAMPFEERSKKPAWWLPLDQSNSCRHQATQATSQVKGH